MTYGIKMEDELIRLEQAALSHRGAAEEMKQDSAAIPIIRLLSARLSAAAGNILRKSHI